MIVAAFEPPAKSGQVRRAEPQLFRPAKHVHAAVRAADVFHDLAGPVGRAVVDNEDVEPRVLRQHRLDESRDILALVVGGHDDKGAPRVERALVAVGGTGCPIGHAYRMMAMEVALLFTTTAKS